MLRSNLCDYSDAHIFVKGNIVNKTASTAEDPNNTAANVTATNTANDNSFGGKKLVFKYNAPFINCVLKINWGKVDNAEDLDVVMPKYNLLQYSKNYRKTTVNLWNYYGEEPNSGADANNITHSILNSNPFLL